MEIRQKLTELQGPEQTAAEMARLAVTYSGDLGELAKKPLIDFFRIVRELPYRRDPAGVETISRPALLLRKDYPWRDCDDKAILIAAWLVANGRPFAFYAFSELAGGRPLHHVCAATRDAAGNVLPLDATYKKNAFGQWPKHTYKTILGGEFMPPYLSTLEGSNLGFSLKSIKKAAVKTVKAPVRAVKASDSQLKKGNVIQAAKAAVKPIPYANRAINATQSAAGQLKRGNVLKAGKVLTSAAASPLKDAAGLIGRNMPTTIKNAVKSAVRKIAGDKVTAATKAAILPAATAAALAVPGVQPFALAVPVVVNLALDEIAAAAKKKAGAAVSSAKKKIVSSVKPKAAAAPKAPAAAPKASAADNARARALALKNKMEASKAAQTSEAAAPEAADEEAAPKAGISTGAKIGIAAGVAGVALLAVSRRRKGRQ